MKSIRSKIMWLLFSSVLIASLVIGSLGIYLTSDIIKESSTENMRLLCKNNADKIDVTFAKIEESIDTLAHYVESELPDADVLKDNSFRQEFSHEVQKNALHHIESINGAAAIYLQYNYAHVNATDGFLFTKSSQTDDFKAHPLTDLSSIESKDEATVNWWFAPIENGAPTWFEAYFDSTLNQYVISYVVPIYKDEKLIGIIGADVFTEYVENLVKEISIFNSGQGAVLNSDGTVLYHPRFEQGEVIGEDDPSFGIVIEKLTQESNSKELISYELNGEKKKITSCKLINGMFMVCFAPEAEIYAHQNAFIVSTLIITAVVLFVMLFVAFLMSTKFATPIKKLNEAAKHLTDGDFDINVSVNTQDEIGELTKTFIETRKIIKNQIHLLDKEAHRDGLTGVYNKSAYMDKEEELNKAILSGNVDFSVFVFDVNKLKAANDVFGHMAGDRLLLTFANHLSKTFGSDNVFRIGGDEFVVILPEKHGVDSKNIISQCLDGLKELSVEGFPECSVSSACGFARFNKETDKQLSDVLNRADKEMYKNKTETKRDLQPWQYSVKGVNQLQIDKYRQLLKSLKDSTDDSFFLLNIETGLMYFFTGGDDISFNITNNDGTSNGIDDILKYIHPNDQSSVKNAIQLIMNRDSEVIDVSFRVQNRSGIHWVNCRGNVVRDEMDNHFAVIGRISQNAVKHLYNPITALFNKIKLKKDLQDEVINKFNYLMLIDINNFSEINLKHGSDYGDKLLKTLAEELEKRFLMWQIYHAEKDRFVVLLNIDGNKELQVIFNQIKKELSDKCVISASVVPNAEKIYISADNIYDYAVQVLNSSKKTSVGQLHFFSEDSLLERFYTVELLEELKASIKNKFKGFSLVYQPQINSKDFSIFAAEALLRFYSDATGAVYPNDFIPVLERTGLINEVGLWVIDQALRQCKKWQKYVPDFKISVNISPRQLENKYIVTQITKLLSKHQLSGDALILEITESEQLSETVMSVLEKLYLSGIQIAIDDFGKGYSNLSNLKHVNASILKIDRVFVKDVKENSYNYNLIYNILKFAESNSLKVCLEGIETLEELLVLSSLNADILQGYLFDKPCAADVLETKYFLPDSVEYSKRNEQNERLSAEKHYAPIVNMEIKTILSDLDIGLWIIRINAKTGEGELYSDEVMLNLLGVDNRISPKECYAHWRKNILPEHVEKVDKMVEEMCNSNSVMQVEYKWLHPEQDELLVRCSGRCTKKNDEVIVCEGFHRIISKTEKTFK